MIECENSTVFAIVTTFNIVYRIQPNKHTAQTSKPSLEISAEQDPLASSKAN